MANTHASPASRRRFQVRAEQMLDWLATAMDSTGRPIQDTHRFDDTFRPDGDELHDRIQIPARPARLRRPPCRRTPPRLVWPARSRRYR
jgi:hypothetical protein